MEIPKAVTAGEVSQSMSSKFPGNLNHSRWVATANRVLRLYVATQDPTRNLSDVENYVMVGYVPLWFKLKYSPSVRDGAKHVFSTIRKVMQLGHRLQENVLPVVHRNVYFAHLENILLSKPPVRELGWRKILIVRNESNKLDKYIRDFSLPDINTNADEYYLMIDWKTTRITEAPATRGLTEDDKSHCIYEKQVFSFRE